MKRKICLWCILGASLWVLFSGCGIEMAKTPTETVKAFYRAANRGRYSEIEKYLSPDALKGMRAMVLLAGREEAIDELTRQRTIKKIEILKEEVQGEEVTVNFVLHFRDGNTHKESLTLIKEKGMWKLKMWDSAYQ